MISKILAPVLNLFRFHKKKLFVGVLIYIVLLSLLFPFDDLSDFIATEVSDLTQGNVQLHFAKASFSLLPPLGLHLNKVSVQSTSLPRKLDAGDLWIGPNLTSFLAFKPGISAHAEGLFDGTVDVSTRGGDKTQGGIRRQKITANFQNLNVKNLLRQTSSDLNASGYLSGGVQTTVDPSMGEPPEGNIDLEGNKLTIVGGKLNTPMGPIDLPAMNIDEFDLRGAMDKGQLNVEDLTLGKQGGDMYLHANGTVNMRFDRTGTGGVDGYDLNIKIQLGENARSKLGAFLGIVSSYSTGPGAYAFRAYSTGGLGIPQFSRIQ